MDAGETSSVTKAEEISDGESLPKDIDFENRKRIVREELNKILGKPRVSEKKRLKHERFVRNKVRERIAKASRRKNKIKR